jgi:hypothetical protein
MPAWISWTLGYAVAIWGVNTVFSLLEPQLNQANPRMQEIAAGTRFLIPLVLAFLIGFRLRVWWWMLGPFLVFTVPMLTFVIAAYLKRSPADRRQAFGGVIFGIGAMVIDAMAVTLSAFTGVGIGRWWPNG